MSGQSQFQSSQEMSALFAQSGKIASNAAKRFGSGQAAKATRDLLLHFDHPNIAFGLRSIKRNVKALQEAQHGILMHAESVEQIASGTLLAPSSFDRAIGGRRRMRIGLISLLQESSILHFPISDLGRIKLFQALRYGLFDRLMHVREQRFHLARPPLLLFFVQQGQLALMMDVAQSVLTRCRLPVRRPTIVEADPSKRRQN